MHLGGHTNVLLCKIKCHQLKAVINISVAGPPCGISTSPLAIIPPPQIPKYFLLAVKTAMFIEDS